MKILFYLVLFLGWSHSAQSNQCGSLNCYSSCDAGYVWLEGNTCGEHWDSERNCYAAHAYCSSPGAGSCHGQTVSCYSGCDGNYLIVHDNTCESVWDYERNCYTVTGSCN